MSDRLILERECEHGLIGEHDRYTSKPLTAESGYAHFTGYGAGFLSTCPGGERREVVVDYEAAAKAYKRAALDNLGWSDGARRIVGAALGLETAEGLEET